MTPATTFRGKRVALFGLGGSGLSAARALVAGGAVVAAWDDNERGREAGAKAGIPIVDLSEAAFAEFSSLVLAPGVPLTHPEPHWTAQKARAAGVEVIGDIEIFCRERAAIAPGSPFVAITGTNGKSTTTALVTHILRASGRDAQMGGNIGTPILDLEPPAQDRFHVVECSSYQIDLAPSLAPRVGVMLNLSEDHLDRHGSMENYAAIKERLVAGVEEGGTAVIGMDDTRTAMIADRLARSHRVARISARQLVIDGVYADGAQLFRAEGGATRVIADLSRVGSLRGSHNAQNAAAAAAALLALGLSEAEIATGIATFPGLAHRLEEVRRIGRVLFVNDSKATNADSAEQALAAFPGDVFWIAGGRAKSGGITALQPFFGRISKAFLVGEAAEEFARTLEGRVAYSICGTIEHAVVEAADAAAASDALEPVVLLSPACASFDQFPNFEVRGDHFRTLVNARPNPDEGSRP